MLKKLVSVPIQDVNILPTTITEISGTDLAFITDSMRTPTAADLELFFIVVVKQNKKYVLVDRYDVYLAAIEANIQNVLAVILPGKRDSNINNNNSCIKAHLQLTVKSVLNPIKILSAMKPFVDKYGLDETIKKLHLNSDFAYMYNLELDMPTIDKLGKLISGLCIVGVKSAIPITLLAFITNLEKSRQSEFIKSIDVLANKMGTKFQWPNNSYLRAFESGNITDKKASPSPKKLPPPEIEFCCDGCNTDYIVMDGIVNKKTETKDSEIHAKMHGIPRILVPPEQVEYLGVTTKQRLKMLSSADVDLADIAKHLDGKKFLVLVGGKK